MLGKNGFPAIDSSSTTLCRDDVVWRLALMWSLLWILLIVVFVLERLLLLLLLLNGIRRWVANAARFKRESALHQQGLVRRREANRQTVVVGVAAVIVIHVADAQLAHHRLIAVLRLSL